MVCFVLFNSPCGCVAAGLTTRVSKLYNHNTAANKSNISTHFNRIYRMYAFIQLSGQFEILYYCLFFFHFITPNILILLYSVDKESVATHHLMFRLLMLHLYLIFYKLYLSES